MDYFVVLAFLIVLALIIIIPIKIAYLLKKKFAVPWVAFIIAAIFFFVVQLFHTPLVLIIQPSLLLWLSALQNHMLEVAIFAIILGLLAGLFEEIGRYLIVKYYVKKKKVKADKEHALMFGIGWGWGECIFVGVLLLGSLLSYVAISDWTPAQISDLNATAGGKLTDAQIQQITAQVNALHKLSPYEVFISLIERMMTLVLQIAFTVLVFKAVITNKKSLLILAVLFHALVDAVAVFSGQFNGAWLTELAVFAFMVIGAVIIYRQFSQNKARTNKRFARK